MNRPIVLAGLGFAGGTLLGSTDVAGEWVITAMLAVTALLLFLTARRRPRYAAFALIALFAALALLLWNVRHASAPGDPLARYAAANPETIPYTLAGRVERPDVWLSDQDYTSFVLRCDSVAARGQHLALEGGVLVRWSRLDGAPPIYPGDRVRVEGPLTLSLTRINPGTPSPEDYYRRHGVHTAMRVYGPDAVELLDHASWYNPAHLLARFRGHVARSLEEVVPHASLPLVLTVWLGDRNRIDPDVYATFLESGTAHILAVSGVHTGIIFASLAFFLRLVITRKRLRILIILAAVFAFALFAGARVSSLRAAIMIALYLTAGWFDREPDAPTALSLAAILFLLHNPDVLFDIGFQLSFVSIGSILLFSDPLYARLTALPMPLREGAASTLAVQLLPLPVALRAFHVLPLAAPLVNLLVIPLLGVLLWLAFITSALTLVFRPVALLFAYALHPVAQAIHFLARSVADTPAHAYLPAPSTGAIAAYALFALALYFALAGRRARVTWGAAAATAFFVAVAVWRPMHLPAEVTVLDVGHGDAIFIRAPGGGTMLVDAGDSSPFTDYGRRYVAPYLWNNYETHLDVLLVTHPDRDHIGGARYILEHIPVGAVILGPMPFTGTLEDALIATCRGRGVPVHRLGKGDSFWLGDARVDVLHPARGEAVAADRNDNSLTVRVAWPGFSILLPGDLEAAGELAALPNLSAATVLKVPHHGSGTSSTDPFLDAVRPSVAIVSVGPRGQSTVLDPSVVARYTARGIPLLRTDRLGGIRIRPDGAGLRIHAARPERGYLTRDTPVPELRPRVAGANSPAMW